MDHERIFYEVMWRIEGRGRPLPLPWWVQQHFRRWLEPYDQGLFDSKYAAFASNALYRYWNMVGVKDRQQESLVGQAGEVEPVYDKYALSFFLFDPTLGQLHFPQYAGTSAHAPSLTRELESAYLPIVQTTYHSTLGVTVEQKVLATTTGLRQRTVVLVRFRVRLAQGAPIGTRVRAWLYLAVSPAGPTGFQRHDRAGRYVADRRISRLDYLPAESRIEVNSTWGPTFDAAPAQWGLYGNPNSQDPDFYLANNPYTDLASSGLLNSNLVAEDNEAGICTAAFGWPFDLDTGADTFTLDVRLPVDDYRGGDDLLELRSEAGDDLEQNNLRFWVGKLDGSGLQATLPPGISGLWDLYRTCRANVLILADAGAIHPGPTIYDSFWIRDSSVEGIAAALAGDSNLAERQFGRHYPHTFDGNRGRDPVGEVSMSGFFGGEHERADREWDANGQALWAIGRFDRIRGSAQGFGSSLFAPYVLEGARWLRDNRDRYGLLHSGWSAEHLGDKGKPHFWDDFWGLAGLWEAAQLAGRIGSSRATEIWDAYADLSRATRDSILYVLEQQRVSGAWETYIPTGPADVSALDSTMIGAASYFHPCRLYMGKKLGDEVDSAARLTLETIWGHFVSSGGFRHDKSWGTYGPYLSLQLAHAFLLLGDVERMGQCLNWAIRAAYVTVGMPGAPAGQRWQVVLGAWNEQQAYPIASDFADVPGTPWYMGDIPHGWACAELMLLLRDMLFFEAAEDSDPHIYIAPGIKPEWLGDSESIDLLGAPTVFGTLFGYRLTHDQANHQIVITIRQSPPANVRFVYPCRFGTLVVTVTVDGTAIPVSGPNVQLPVGSRQAVISYQ